MRGSADFRGFISLHCNLFSLATGWLFLYNMPLMNASVILSMQSQRLIHLCLKQYTFQNCSSESHLSTKPPVIYLRVYYVLNYKFSCFWSFFSGLHSQFLLGYSCTSFTHYSLKALVSKPLLPSFSCSTTATESVAKEYGREMSHH